MRCPRSRGCRRAKGKLIPLSGGRRPARKASQTTSVVYTCGGELGDPTLLPWEAHLKQTSKVLLFQAFTSASSPQILQKPTHELKQQLAGYSKRVASSVTELIQAAEAMKG